jgi:D-beta-D-heptose 7-phosphate kinase/D-beta-D-heptose 1-phosphate adenosyltransferase
MPSNSKILTLEDLLALRLVWKAQGKTVVWTNGCFDLLHTGHVRSFREAKALGNILVVGINSDSSVKAIKGHRRPVVSEDDRAEVVAALEAVDCVTIFDEPDPVTVLSRLRPDIHCKGAEYASGKRPVPERDIVLGYGGQIRFLPLHQGHSTTGLIERICAAAVEDACTK